VSAPTFKIDRSGSLRRARRLLAGSVLACALFGLALAGFALAGGTPVVSASHNSRLHASILVNAQGRTLYVLSPESTHHLLCTSRACLSAWPPLTVSHSARLSEGSGVHGSLGVLRRGGSEQITLNGMPLYLFAGDRGRGEANGEGLSSFGGTWHAVLASGRPR
jgi:predicted lipoprotein with Yx(FWY)xxD motif